MNNQGILLERTHEFNKIVQSYSSILFATVIHLTKDRQTSEDIVQESFLKLWENRVDIKTDNIGGWLYRVACNLAYKHLRRESRKTRITAYFQTEKQNSGNEVEERLLQKESSHLFTELYSRLPEKQQAVYLLSSEEGLSRNEIAHHLNISPNTVKNHLARAVRFIRENVRCACLLFLFFLINYIFFSAGSTKVDLRDLYKEQRTNKDAGTDMNNRYQHSYSTFMMRTNTVFLRPVSSI